MAEEIRVNFGKPLPVFPLPDAVLLPHSIQPLQITESRYRRMVDDCLDSSGQIAMATFARHHSPDGTVQSVRLRPAVCIGQIVQHEAMPAGAHNVVLHGVCRAKIVNILEPDATRRYRLASLRPIEPIGQSPPPLVGVRRQLRGLLGSPRLSRMRSVDTVMEWFDCEDITTHALLELIGFLLVHDTEIKYRLLAEGCPKRRAELITTELMSLDRLVQLADMQSPADWPKGMSWN